MTNTRNDKIHDMLVEAQKRSLLFARPGFLIRRLHQIHSGLFIEETSEFNITPVQYSLLSALDEHGEMDQNSLALEIGLERTSVAEVLPRLEMRGLLARRQSSEDRRVRLAQLTQGGKDLLQRMAKAAQRAHDRTIEQLTENEREVFMLNMIRLIEANNEHSLSPLRLR
jgi:DNA-binding MarR family transcriptional regulator